MISGIFHQGSGLGNQLHRYVAMRVLALDKGYGWFIRNPHYFKGWGFMGISIQGGYTPEEAENSPDSIFKNWHEKKVDENGISISSYDPEFNFIQDNTIIDGEFQDERYFEHRMDEVDEWLKVEPYLLLENTCLICFRGGEYTIYPDLFLTADYWNSAINLMKKERPDMKFLVVTDDYPTARKFFPDYDIMDDVNGKHDMGVDWRATRYASYLILSNASFYILPALLNDKVKKIYAPRYWARHNVGVWSMPQNYYKKFSYI